MIFYILIGTEISIHSTWHWHSMATLRRVCCRWASRKLSLSENNGLTLNISTGNACVISVCPMSSFLRSHRPPDKMKGKKIAWDDITSWHFTWECKIFTLPFLIFVMFLLLHLALCFDFEYLFAHSKFWSHWRVVIPHTTSLCGYNVFDLSVSPSVCYSMLSPG
jgi:hypothetical protein